MVWLEAGILILLCRLFFGFTERFCSRHPIFVGICGVGVKMGCREQAVLNCSIFSKPYFIIEGTPQYKPSKMEFAMEFALDFQELSSGCEDHKKAMEDAMKKHLDKIDRTKSDGQTIAFTDNSKATWVGNAFQIH
jgi:hypothetical protein